MGPTKKVSFRTFDGTLLRGNLYLPEKDNAPVVIMLPGVYTTHLITHVNLNADLFDSLHSSKNTSVICLINVGTQATLFSSTTIGHGAPVTDRQGSILICNCNLTTSLMQFLGYVLRHPLLIRAE